jgi:hypothetical protein
MTLAWYKTWAWRQDLGVEARAGRGGKTWAWRIEFEAAARKKLSKLDREAAQRITAFLRERVAPLDPILEP